MKKALFLAVAAAAGIVSCAETSKPVQNHQLQPVKKGRGFATAKVERPAHFPHRIWAFSGFESRPDNFGWFGAAETKNILKYPGNTAARRGTPQKKWSALKTGMNPVPGPRMGKLNKLYIRYYLKGTDTVRFQHYSLSSGDNCNILVSGLEQGRWAETVLNFTRDSRRNDGSPGAFKEGERMDDLQVYVGKPADGKQYEIIIDDAILFAEAPGAPPADEPFPSRVVFLAAFDTGIDARSRPRYWPGQLEIASGAKAPRGSYWAVARAVPAAGGKESHVLLEMKPPRPVGAVTKLRFRYWVEGAKRMKVVLHDATAKALCAIDLEDIAQKNWTTRHLDFSKDAKVRKAKAAGKPLAVGNKVDSLSFIVAGSGQKVRLFVDEVVLYDAGSPGRR